MSELESKIREIAEPFVEAMGLEIWGIDITQFHKTVIRIYVDIPSLGCNTPDQHKNDAVLPEHPFESTKQKSEESQNNSHEPIMPLSISIDQCAKISRRIGLVLEVEDIIPSAYTLEVSSPGFSRQFFKLSQLHSYLGDSVEIVLKQGHQEWDNRKKFTGTLEKITDTGICMHLMDLDKAKNAKKGKKALSSGAYDLTQSMLIEWVDIRIIKKIHTFNASNIVRKKRKNEH